jgi:hypothetical protein
MGTVQEKQSFRGNQNKLYVQLLFVQKSFCYGIMWKNIVQPYRPQVTIRRMHLACKISTATNTNSEYVTLLSFAWQQWLRDRASMLLYTYIAFLLTSYITLCLTKWCVPFPALCQICIFKFIFFLTSLGVLCLILNVRSVST